MNTISTLSLVFLLAVSPFSKTISSLNEWCEANALSVQYFKENIQAVPQTFYNQISELLVPQRCSSDATQIANAGFTRQRSALYSDMVKTFHRQIPCIEKNDGASWSMGSFQKPMVWGAGRLTVSLEPDSVAQTPIPFLLFAIGLFSALKMKWIRLKTKIEIM